MFKRINTLAQERGISRKTVQRRLKMMRELPGFYEGRDYRKDGHTVAISEASYDRLRRGINEGRYLITTK